MNKEQAVAAIVAAVALIGGSIAYKLDDGSVYEVPESQDCTWQPARAPVIPCLPDGGWDPKAPSYRDAGCLAQVCPALADVRERGGIPVRTADVKAKGILTKQPDAVPIDATPVAEEAAPVEAKP